MKNFFFYNDFFLRELKVKLSFCPEAEDVVLVTNIKPPRLTPLAGYFDSWMEFFEWTRWVYYCGWWAVVGPFFFCISLSIFFISRFFREEDDIPFKFILTYVYGIMLYIALWFPLFLVTNFYKYGKILNLYEIPRLPLNEFSVNSFNMDFKEPEFICQSNELVPGVPYDETKGPLENEPTMDWLRTADIAYVYKFSYMAVTDALLKGGWTYDNAVVRAKELTFFYLTALRGNLFKELEDCRLKAQQQLGLFDSMIDYVSPPNKIFFLKIGPLSIDWSLLFDPTALAMLVVIIAITFCVISYSTDYMVGDLRFTEFFIYLAFFMSFMLLLVTSTNFIQLFVGWEGVGIMSFLLVNFWWGRVEANISGLKAVLMNRFGDISLLLAFSLILLQIGTLEINKLQLLTLVSDSLDFIAILFVVGAVGKSAQLGLHTWLPDAMEGPTPVSALLHAATMVTAGIFLLFRVSILLECSLIARTLVMVIGVLTIFFAGAVALAQQDIKKIIAYSTCSQLGYMFYGMGLLLYGGTLFHLFNHAFFKALLFLSAGLIVHNFGDDQDLRKYGKLALILPIVYTAFIVGSLSLAGFPFLSGFFSKEFILAIAFYEQFNSFIYVFCYITAISGTIFTVAYSFRLIVLAFFKNVKSVKTDFAVARKIAWEALVPVTVLVFASIFSGFVFNKIFIEENYFENKVKKQITKNDFMMFSQDFLESSNGNSSLVASEQVLPLVIVLSSLVLSAFFWFFGKNSDMLLTKFTIYFFINNSSKRWIFDIFYNKVVGFTLLFFSNLITKKVERGFFEYPVFIASTINTYMIVRCLLGFGRRYSTFRTYTFAIMVVSTILCFYSHFTAYLHFLFNYFQEVF